MQIRFLNTIRPDVPITGLLILLILSLTYSYELLPVKILSRLFLDNSPYDLPTVPGILETDFSYSPLLKELRRSKEDDFNSFLDFMHGKARLSFGNNSVRSTIAYYYDSYCSAVKIDSTSYSAISSQYAHQLAASFWYSVNKMNFGVSSGTLVSPVQTIKVHIDHKTDYLKSGLFQYGFYTDGIFDSFGFHFQANFKPLYIGETQIIKNSAPEIYRSFPLLFHQLSIQLGTEYTTGTIVSSMDVSCSKINNNKDIQSTMQMPLRLNLNSYSLKYKGQVTKHNLFWSLNTLNLGGWCGGYANSLNGMNFFSADSIRMRSWQANFGINDSSKHSISVEGGFLSLLSPYGFLNLAPFSQWTILHSMAYKFYGVDLFYTEAGLTMCKTFHKNNLNPLIKLGIHYFATHGTYRLRELDVVIFFPDYKDKGEQKIWDTKGILFTPEFFIPCTIGLFNIAFSIDGIIPLTFKNGGQDGEGSTIIKSSSKMGDVIGGVTATTTILIPVFKRKK